MRTFYIYNINDFLHSLYDNYPHNLYKMLEEAHYSKKHNLAKSATIYDQLITNYNKLYINNFLNINNKIDVYYYNKNNTHLISSRGEYTKLTVNSYCIKVKSNLNYPKFFYDINNYSNNIFICDFDNQDYFWLNKIVKNEKILV